MAQDEAYREAERRIDRAWREGTAKLNLSGMNLTEVPEAIASLTWLTTLFLSDNQLTSLPKVIASFTRLTTLDLSNNKLTSLPEAIASFTQLKTLYLFSNHLTSLPKEIASLIQLTKLDLFSNKLTSIPEGIGSLEQLTTLILSDNQLTSLPEAISSLTRLKELGLSGNPLEPELAAAYGEGIESVFQFLRAKAKKSIVLNEAKLILIGEGEVGKTSLLGALRGDDWIEERQTTHGVEVDIKSLSITHLDSGTKITFNGWDFGGQNIYRHTHQLFFTSPAIYVAVWNPRRGPAQCRVVEWIKMVKHRAYNEARPDEKPYILVVATHGGPKERLDSVDRKGRESEL